MSRNVKANGINHLALSTSNMKEQIAFFSDVLGMELVALYWMHGTDGCWHGFMRMNENCAVAFVFHPDNEMAKLQLGHTHAGHGAGSSSPGTMQHLALNVDSLEDVLNMRDRIRSRGVNVMGPLDHGMCHSIYFAGPENLTLEIATYGDAQYPIGADDWVDDEVRKLAGISDAELQSYIKPAEYEGEGGAVPQPGYDPAGYNLSMPVEMLKGAYAMPDEMVTKNLSEPLPPSKMNAEDHVSKHAK